jgi:hypothetical protein
MAITVFIEYRLDPFKHCRFEEYAKRWVEIIPRCGADLVGYWMQHEGTNDAGYALISCHSLAPYKAYRARLREDGAGMANLRFVQKERFIALVHEPLGIGCRLVRVGQQLGMLR